MDRRNPLTRCPLATIPTTSLAALLLLVYASGCSSFIGTTAGSFMKRVETDADPNVRYRAYAKLADPMCYTSEEQKATAIALLSSKLEAGQEPIAARAQICRTLGRLERPEARPALIQTVKDESPLVRIEACRAIGRVGDPADAPVLSRIMTTDMDMDCRLAAIEALGLLDVGDPRVEEQLVLGMEHHDPAIRLACYRALRSRSGQDLGPEPAAWRAHYAASSASPGPDNDPEISQTGAEAPSAR